MGKNKNAAPEAPALGVWLALRRPFGQGAGSGSPWEAMARGSKAGVALAIWRRYKEQALDAERSPCSGGRLVGPPRSRWDRPGDRPQGRTDELMVLTGDGVEVDPLGLAVYGGQIAQALDAAKTAGERWGPRGRLCPQWNGEGPVPGTGRPHRWRADWRNPSLGFGSKAREGFACAAAAMEMEELDWAGSPRWACELRTRAKWATQGLCAWWDDWDTRARGGKSWKSKRRERQWDRG